jgi:hypothetical protein
MNKILSLTMVFALLLVGFVSATAVPIPTGTTYVTGTVTDSGNNPMPGVALSVQCNSDSTTTTSEADGTYIIGLPNPSCKPGDTAYVTATAYDVTKSGVVCDSVLDHINCHIDIALVDVTIPEFGVIAGAAALVGALGIFIYRRKN